MTISFINAASTVAVAAVTNVTINKPTNTADGDLMVAFLFCGTDGTAVPAGWASYSSNLISGVNWSKVYTKIASSEGANYTWSFALTTAGGTITTWRGAAGIHRDSYATSTTSDPITTPTVVTTADSKILYLTQRRQASSTVMTYTAGSGTERFDTGSTNGTVSYSHALYEASGTTSAGSISGLSITDNGTPTSGHHRTIALQELVVPTTPNLMGRAVIL